MDDLRSWWEVPSIAHFCSLFRSAFDLTDFDIEDLEEGLLESQNEEGSAFLLDLLCRLLNGCYSRKDISVANYDLYVKDIIKYRWDGSDNPIKEKSEFKTLSLREKVELIYSICETRVDAEDVTDQLKGFEGDSMRVEPLGKDKDGAQYWYFYGTRLYVEDPEKKQELSKEEKRAKDRQRRIETKKKKLEEKRQRKEEKRKLKALRKAERKKKLEGAARNQKAEETNTRRSGRLRNKKIEIPKSESSETSSSSSDEEETEESSQEEDEEVETVQQNSKGKKQPPKKTPAKKNTKKGSSKTNEEENESEVEEETPAKTTRAIGRGSKTPAKTLAKRDTGNKRTESTPKETPKTTRSGRRSVAPDKTPNQESNSGTHRSSRSSKKPSTPVLPSPYNSETEEENEYDVDSGHESAGSEVSKMSVRSSTSRRSLQEAGKSSRKPTANVHLRRDLSGGDEEEDIEGEEEVENEEEEMDTEENKHRGDDTVEDVGDKTDDTQKDENGKSDKLGDQDANPEHNLPKSEQNNAEVSLSENKTDINSDNTSREPKFEAKQEINDVEEMDITDNKNSVKPVKEENVEVKIEENVDRQEKKGKIKDEMDAEKETEDTEGCENKEVTEEHNGEYKRVLRKREVEEDKKDTSESKQNMKKAKLTLDRPAEAPKHSMSSTRWHLVCETLEDWINLAEWFKDSTVKCEKSLSKLIREDFLPVLPEIFEAREKEKMKRLLQEQELRRSNRITIKMREKMEQEKILAEAFAEEEKARIRAEEEKRLKEEQLKLEEENKLREERRLAREERAQRLRLREERAQLLAEGKEIPPEMIYTGSQKYKDDEDSDDSKCDLKEEEDYQALMKVISAMKYHKDCWPFLEPVTDEEAPGYSDVIKRPMDMTKIEEKLENREYRSTRHFLSDFRLMFNNCKRFNGADSEFSECARSMEQMLKKYMKRFVSDEPTDKYYEDQDFVVSGGKGGARGEKRYRPQRAASSRAIETVHKALNDDDESDTDEDDIVPQRKKPRDGNTKDSLFKTQSHHSLLLQEMIELKRQREKKLAASALHNHQVITRGAERIRIPNQEGGGVMIIPKGELNPTGVLRMAATREIRRKVGNPAFAGTTPPITYQTRPTIHNLGSNNAVVTKKDPGLSIIDQTTPGSNQPKTIRIVASNVNGQPSVKQTAENVKISADGYLIISGKNSGIKVTENTKIVIQPPAAAPPSADGSNLPVGVGKEIVFKKIPAPASLKTLPGLGLSSTDGFPSSAAATGNANNSANVTPVRIGQPAVIKTIQSLPSGSSQATSNANSTGGSPDITQQKQGPTGTGTPIDLQGLLRQTAVSSIVNEQQLDHLRGIVQQLENTKTPLSPDMMKKLDIAQRILLLNQKKRSLMEQRQEQLLQQQQQLPSLSKSANVIKLEPDARASNSGAIEQILRDPGVNIDNQLGSVSKSVISNVNIAGDILDSYYSVMNEAKSKTMAANSAAGITHPVTRPVSQPVTQSGHPDQSSIKLPTPQSPLAVQRTLEQIITGMNVESPKPVQSQGTISEVTRQIYNLINKSGTGGIVEALARAQLMKQNSQLLQKQVSSNLNQSPVNLNSPTTNLMTTNSTVTTVQTGLQIPVSQNQSQLISSTVVTQSGLYMSHDSVQSTIAPAETFHHQESQISHGSVQSDSVQPVSAFQCGLQTSGSPTGGGLKTSSANQNILTGSDVQLSVGINKGQLNSPTATSVSGIDSKTLLDLLRSSLAVKSECPSSEVSPIEALLSKTSTSPKSDSILKAHLTQALTNKMSTPRQNLAPQTVGVMHEKSDRQNLFDTFEAQPQGASAGVAAATSNEIDVKERLKGVKVPTNSTLNYGSPLKTMSIMEALKSKLHTIKPDQQIVDSTTHTVTEANHEGHCICSELSHHSPSCAAFCGLSAYSVANVASETFNSFSACNRSVSPNCSVELPNSGVPLDIVQSEKIPQNIRGNETNLVKNDACSSESDIFSSSDYAENKFKLNADMKIDFDRDLDVVVPWNFVDISKLQHPKSNFEKPMRLVIKGRQVQKVVITDLHREDSKTEHMNKGNQVECRTDNYKNTISSTRSHGKAGVHLTVNTMNGEEEVARYEQNEQGDWVLASIDNENITNVSVGVQTDKNNNRSKENAVYFDRTERNCKRVKRKITYNEGDNDEEVMPTGDRTNSTDTLQEEAGYVYPRNVCAKSTENIRVRMQNVTPSENPETVAKSTGNVVEKVFPRNAREPLRAKGFCFIKLPSVLPSCDQPQSESPVKETVTRRTYCSRSDMGLESCPVQNYVVQRPLLHSKSLGNISDPVVNSDPVYLSEPLLPGKKMKNQRAKPDKTSTEALEKDLTNVRLKTKVGRLSLSPVKMYKIPSLKQIARTCKQTQEKLTNIKDSKGPGRKSVHEVKDENNLTDPPDEVQIACEVLMKLADDDSALTDNDSTFETETSLEASLSCNEDFFSTELLSDFFPSNPVVDGDGSDVDHDLEQIEDDIFELQDQYPSSKSFVGNLPAINQMGLSTRVTSPSNLTSQPAASGQMFNADLQSVPQPVFLPSQRPSVPQQQVAGVHRSMLQAPGVQGSTLQAPDVQGSRQQTLGEQSSLQQAPRIQVNQLASRTGIQLSSTLLAVLQKAAGGMVLNPATQTAMIQHLTSLLNKRQQNATVIGQKVGNQNISPSLSTQNANIANTLQVGNQNISPSTSVQIANMANTSQVGNQNIVSSTNSQLNSIQNQLKPTVNSVNYGQQNVEYQDISEMTNPNLVSSTQIQTNSVHQILGHLQANSATGNSCVDETNFSSANLVSNEVHNGMTRGGYVEYSPATSTDINNQMSLQPNFGSDLNSVTNANNGESSFTSNVLLMEGMDFSEQSGFQVTQSNMEAVGTSQIASFSEIPENQSVENEENN